MRPKVIVNVAMSADGKIALPDKSEVKISGEDDFKRVHELRNRVDAILVGIGTVLADDPKLTVKEKYVEKPKHPLKVVLDSKARTPKGAQLFEKGDWLIATTEDVDERGWIRCGRGDEVDLELLMEELVDRGVEELLVEGGGEVISSFFEFGAVNEFNVFVGSLVIGGKEAPTPVDGLGAEDMDDLVSLKLKDHEELDDGILLKYTARSEADR
ncbi:MAG: dihydrofolate reductase family protein [Candidatus Thermoplasmatota archaeon]